MLIKKLVAREIKDTRGDKTIEIFLKTKFGKFKASAPNGKSRGKYEAKPWKKSLVQDIKLINSCKLISIKLDNFDDLKNLEEFFVKKVGANSMIALEYVFLKALAKKEKKEVWQLINPDAKKIPMPVGNAIGGGAHSKIGPDIQEFLFISNKKRFVDAVKVNKKAYVLCKKMLEKEDVNFKNKKSDENAWQTSLSNLKIMRIMEEIKEKFSNLKIGMDVASSQFYKNKKYCYKNEKVILDKNEQLKFVSELSKIFYYIEDPFVESDFESYKKLKTKNLIVGDDLTVTNLSRIKKAKIRGLIIKPNQVGSLIEVKKIVDYCKKNKIKTIFSHRSGETKENILADIAFGFQGDFIKTGIWGKGRKEKLKRLIKIEKSLM
jgi:enolase